MGRIALTLTALFVGAGTASADLTFTAKFDGANPANTLQVNGPSGTPTGGVLVGQYNWHRTSGATLPFMTGNNFSTFCLEVTQAINNDAGSNGSTYTIKPLAETPRPGNGQGSGTSTGMGPARAATLQSLFDLHYQTNFTATQASAFQLAIWEVIFETSSTYSVTGGNGSFSLNTSNSAIRTQANDYLTSLASVSNANRPSQQWQLFAMSNQGSQDQVAVYRVPEPASVMMALAGVGPLAAVVRLRRRLV